MVIILIHFVLLQQSQVVTGIVFSMQELGCENKHNYFLSPHHRSSFTVDCQVQGTLFLEKHTKLFVFPQNCAYLRSPHTESNAIKGRMLRIQSSNDGNAYGLNRNGSSVERTRAVWSTEEFGGVFVHYNRMKYSTGMGSKKRKNRRFLDMRVFVTSILKVLA